MKFWRYVRIAIVVAPILVWDWIKSPGTPPSPFEDF